MPTLMTKDDVMRTAVNLGRADKVWSAFCDSSSCPPGIPRVTIGLMAGKWKLPSWEEDKAMDREIEADFEAALESPL